MQTITLNLGIDASKSPFSLPMSLWQNIQDFMDYCDSFDSEGLLVSVCDNEFNKMVQENLVPNDPYGEYFNNLWSFADAWKNSDRGGDSILTKIKFVANLIQEFGAQTIPAAIDTLQPYPQKFYSGNYTQEDFATFKGIADALWQQTTKISLNTQDIDITMQQIVHGLGELSYVSTCLTRVLNHYYPEDRNSLPEINNFQNKITSDYFNTLKGNLQILESTWNTLYSEIYNSYGEIAQIDSLGTTGAFQLFEDFGEAKSSWAAAANDAANFLASMR